MSKEVQLLSEFGSRTQTPWCTTEVEQLLHQAKHKFTGSVKSRGAAVRGFTTAIPGRRSSWRNRLAGSKDRAHR